MIDVSKDPRIEEVFQEDGSVWINAKRGWCFGMHGKGGHGEHLHAEDTPDGRSHENEPPTPKALRDAIWLESCDCAECAKPE